MNRKYGLKNLIGVASSYFVVYLNDKVAGSSIPTIWKMLVVAIVAIIVAMWGGQTIPVTTVQEILASTRSDDEKLAEFESLTKYSSIAFFKALLEGKKIEFKKVVDLKTMIGVIGSIFLVAINDAIAAYNIDSTVKGFIVAGIGVVFSLWGIQTISILSLTTILSSNKSTAEKLIDIRLLSSYSVEGWNIVNSKQDPKKETETPQQEPAQETPETEQPEEESPIQQGLAKLLNKFGKTPQAQ